VTFSLDSCRAAVIDKTRLNPAWSQEQKWVNRKIFGSVYLDRQSVQQWSK
jgi:hypothetical protein